MRGDERHCQLLSYQSLYPLPTYQREMAFIPLAYLTGFYKPSQTPEVVINVLGDIMQNSPPQDLVSGSQLCLGKCKMPSPQSC